jgi:hypothetical protein
LQTDAATLRNLTDFQAHAFHYNPVPKYKVKRTIIEEPLDASLLASQIGPEKLQDEFGSAIKRLKRRASNFLRGILRLKYDFESSDSGQFVYSSPN